MMTAEKKRLIPTLLPNVPVYDGSLFTWARVVNGPKVLEHSGRGMVEASCLRMQPWTRLWNDAADVGFQVRSHRTGKVRVFVMTKEARNDEGEVTHWELASYDDIDNPLFITVFND